MSVQKQLNSFIQAHCERDRKISHSFNDFTFLDYRSGLTDDDLNSCMKELASIVYSPDFGVQVGEDDSGYEFIDDFEEI